MRFRKLRPLVSLLVLTALAGAGACDINPQPSLPTNDAEQAGSAGRGGNGIGLDPGPSKGGGNSGASGNNGGTFGNAGSGMQSPEAGAPGEPAAGGAGNVAEGGNGNVPEGGSDGAGGVPGMSDGGEPTSGGEANGGVGGAVD